MYTTIAPAFTLCRFPRVSAWLRDLGLILGGTLLTALLAQVRLPLPFTPVPLTGQTLAVLLVGAALGSRRGLASMALYTLLGGLGLPFFAGGQGGLAYLAGPTLGYLLGFIAAAWLTGLLAERGLERSLRTSFLPFLAGTLAIYACGAGWLAFFLGLRQALLMGILPFVIGDAIKIVVATLALPAAWKFVR